MPVLSKRVGVVAGLALAAAAAMVAATPATADTAARSGDVVGVGSDTAQNALDFVLDGAPGVAGGYNNLGNNHRALNVFATGDANGRAVYDGTCGPTHPATTGLGTGCEATTNLTPNLLPGSVILRVGTKPVTRPNGSGSGAAALIADSGTGYQGLPTGSIQFARMSRLPNATEEGNCPTTGACGGLHVYQFATDTLTFVKQASGFNGPSAISIDDAYHIFVLCNYTTWNQIPGNSGGSTNTIHPLIPQSGSGTRNFFMADIQAAEGLASAPSPGACTRTVEEHDPTGIYADPAPADAIEPFSSGKLTLINSGYFDNAGYTNSAGHDAYTTGYLTALTGTGTYNSNRGIYVAIRNADLGSTTPFQIGGTQNFAQTLFAGPTSYIARAANAPQIAAAGFTAAYKDCGVNPTTC